MRINGQSKEFPAGGTAVILVVIVMGIMLGTALSVNNMVMTSIRHSRTQLDSTKAFFAAESGSERIMWKFNRDGFDSALAVAACADNTGDFSSICLNNSDPYDITDTDYCAAPGSCTSGNETAILGNLAEFSSIYDLDTISDPDRHFFKTIGSFGEVNRIIELRISL